MTICAVHLGVRSNVDVVVEQTGRGGWEMWCSKPNIHKVVSVCIDGESQCEGTTNTNHLLLVELRLETWVRQACVGPELPYLCRLPLPVEGSSLCLQAEAFVNIIQYQRNDSRVMLISFIRTKCCGAAKTAPFTDTAHVYRPEQH